MYLLYNIYYAYTYCYYNRSLHLPFIHHTPFRRLNQHRHSVFGQHAHRHYCARMLFRSRVHHGRHVHKTTSGQRARNISIQGTADCQGPKRRRNSIFRAQGRRRTSSCHKLVKMIRKRVPSHRNGEIFNLSPEPFTIHRVNLN